MALGLKTGGREAGTPNRETKKLEQFLSEHKIFVPQKLLEVEALIESPKDKAKIWLELMEYLYPKRKAVETSVEINRPHSNLTDEALNRKLFEALPEIIKSLEKDIPNAKDQIRTMLNL